MSEFRVIDMTLKKQDDHIHDDDDDNNASLDNDHQHHSEYDECTSLLFRMLPTDNLHIILEYLYGADMANFSACCKHSRWIQHDEPSWRIKCFLVWPRQRAIKYVRAYRGLYSRLYMHEQHVRFDGHYCLTTQYWKRGGYGYNQQGLLEKVEYHRFVRFHVDGTVSYMLANVYEHGAKLYNSGRNNSQVYVGRYQILSKHALAMQVTARADLHIFMRLEFDPADKDDVEVRHRRLVLKKFWGRTSRGDTVDFPVPDTSFIFERPHAVLVHK